MVYNQKLIFNREIERVDNKCKWVDPLKVTREEREIDKRKERLCDPH